MYFKLRFFFTCPRNFAFSEVWPQLKIKVSSSSTSVFRRYYAYCTDTENVYEVLTIHTL